jgi:hypothetical protein
MFCRLPGIVYAARDEFFACARLADDEDAQVEARGDHDINVWTETLSTSLHAEEERIGKDRLGGPGLFGSLRRRRSSSGPR